MSKITPQTKFVLKKILPAINVMMYILGECIVFMMSCAERKLSVRKHDALVLWGYVD